VLLLLASSNRAEPPGQVPENLSEFARQWAEHADFSGSFRLERGDELLASGSRGTSGQGPITEDTSFWIGSLSKQFAAVAALRLAEQQQLDLKAPLSRYFPELARDALTKEGVPCSVEQVLSHTCGLPRDLGFDPLYTARMLSDPARAQRLFSQVDAAPLAFVPGTEFLYSNAGYALIGLLVQRAAGMPYERYLQQTFWGPLAMSHTGIEPRAGITLARGRVSFGFGSADAASLLLFEPEVPAELGAAGNIYSTPRDLLRWNYALHHGQLLTSASYQSMIEPRKEDYGLGIATKEKAFGKSLYHVGAYAPLSTSALLAYVPGHDLAFAAVSNHASEVSGLTGLADGLLSEASHTPTSTLAHPPSWIQILVGQFPAFQTLIFPGLTLLWYWYCYRQREKLGRVTWWLLFHGGSLLGAITLFQWRERAFDHLLFVWCAAALGLGAVQSWWVLPAWASPLRRISTYSNLAIGVALAGFSLLISPQRVLVPFVAVCVLPGWALAWRLSRRSGRLRDGTAPVG
jgi:CubicO group peptidase (beta-lactamase class C family)